MFLFGLSLNDVDVASWRIMVRRRPTNPHWTRLARPVRSREHSWRFQIHLHLVLPSGQANVEVEQEMPHEQRPMHLGRHSPFFITPRRLILLCLFYLVFICLFLFFWFWFFVIFVYPGTMSPPFPIVMSSSSETTAPIVMSSCDWLGAATTSPTWVTESRDAHPTRQVWSASGHLEPSSS